MGDGTEQSFLFVTGHKSGVYSMGWLSFSKMLPGRLDKMA